MDLLEKKYVLTFMRMYPKWINDLQNPEFPRSEIFLDKVDKYKTADPVGELVSDRMSKIRIVEDSIKKATDSNRKLYVYYLLYFGHGITYKKLRSDFGLHIGKDRFYRIRNDILEKVFSRIKNTSYIGTT